MINKNILFLTHYFPPEVNAPANRTFEHAKLWAQEVNVTVITNFPNHPDGKIFPGYKNKLIEKEILDGIQVVRLCTFITPNEGLILRTLNYIVYMILAVIYVLFSRINFDLVIATTPQFFCALAGYTITRLRRRPFILELRDLWPESIIAVGALKNKTVINFLEYIELKMYRSADRIISVTESFKRNLARRGINKDKIRVVFNGVNPEMFSNVNPILNNDICEFIQNGFIAGYIGTIGMAHSIKTLVEAAELTVETDIKFLIVGSGAEREKLEKEIKLKKLNNIKIFPLMGKNEIAAIIGALDLFIVHLKNDPLFSTVIPSKLFEGMIMKKPILIGVEGEARMIVENAGCGIHFQPENASDLVRKINYYKDNPSKLKLDGLNGFSFVQENFDRRKLAMELLDIIKELTNGSRVANTVVQQNEIIPKVIN